MLVTTSSTCSVRCNDPPIQPGPIYPWPMYTEKSSWRFRDKNTLHEIRKQIRTNLRMYVYMYVYVHRANLPLGGDALS